MDKLIRFQIGESADFKFDRGGDPIDGWTCTITVKKFPSGADLIAPRVIPPVGRAWPGFLTNSETSSFVYAGPTGGLHYLIATLVNLVDDQLEQIPVRLSVTTAWA